MNNNRITINALKTFTGIEGQGFNANLLLDGKKVAALIDEGCGGSLWVQYLGTAEQRRAAEDAVKAAVDAIPPEPMPADAEDWVKTLYTDGFRKLDLEDIVNRMVDDLLNERFMAKKRKTHVLFRTPEQPKDEYFTYPISGHNIDALRSAISAKHPGATFL